jgi:rare lipoprotein A
MPYPHDGQRTLSPRAADLILGLSLVVAVLSLAVAAALLWSQAVPSSKPNTPIWYARHLTQAGIASWYGPRFHGRRTASGEPFDQTKMTAAHRTLRFGTRVVVTKAANGRSVEVRINDRGPFIRDRIIDLSRAAAAELGIKHAGLAVVQVQPLH